MLDPGLPRTLIIISTYNRKAHTALALDSLAKCKAPWTAVHILDDHSTEYDHLWLQNWGFRVFLRDSNIGLALAQKARFDHALTQTDKFGFFVTVDSDLVFSPNFELRMRSLWASSHSPDHTLVSGYHAACYDQLAQYGPYSHVDRVGGCCLGISAGGIKTLMEIVGDQWHLAWDQLTRQMTCLVPNPSLVQHLGNHDDGFHSASWDIAHDYSGRLFG